MARIALLVDVCQPNTTKVITLKVIKEQLSEILPMLLEVTQIFFIRGKV
jgi:hypothetical protein